VPRSIKANELSDSAAVVAIAAGCFGALYARDRYVCWKTWNMLNNPQAANYDKQVYNWGMQKYPHISFMSKAAEIKKMFIRDFNSGYITRTYNGKTAITADQAITYAIEELESDKKTLDPNWIDKWWGIIGFGPKFDLIKAIEEFNFDKPSQSKMSTSANEWTVGQEGFVKRRLDELCASHTVKSWIFWNYKRTYARHCLINDRINRLRFLLALVSETGPASHDITVHHAQLPPTYDAVYGL
jgi:hypothetical protein